MSEVGPDGLTVNLSDGQVTLRLWSIDDAPFLAAAMTDPAIRRYNGAHDRFGRPAAPPSIAEAEARIAEFVLGSRAFAKTGDASGVVFAITDASSGALLGCSGVDLWNDEDVVQFGYWLAAGARGHGYATCAVVLLTQWLFANGAARAYMTVVAGNESSTAVARRAGFTYEGTMRGHSVWQGERQDVQWFAALPHEWMRRTNGAT